MIARAKMTLLLGVLLPVAVSAQASEEYRLKAAFLYNMTKFIEWPVQAFQSANDPVSICILGRNPFGSALADAVAGKMIQDRPLLVKTLPDAREGCACQVLFVSSSERKRYQAILATTAAATVLTVGDSDSFLANGGVVNLKLEGDKVRIQINPAAAEPHHLRISSKLLGLAEIDTGGK